LRSAGGCPLQDRGGALEVSDPSGLFVLAESERDGDGAIDLDARRPELIGDLHRREWHGPDGIIVGGDGLRLCFGSHQAARDCHGERKERGYQSHATHSIASDRLKRHGGIRHGATENTEEGEPQIAQMAPIGSTDGSTGSAAKACV
jgi:hypothetical protein